MLYLPYQNNQNWINAIFSFIGFAVMGTFMVAECRSIAKGMFETKEEREFLPQTKEIDRPKYKSYKVGDYIYDRTELSRRGRIVEVMKGPRGDIYITERPSGFRDRIFVANALPLQMESLPATKGDYRLASTPPKYRPGQRVLRDRLYVLERTERWGVSGEWRKHYEVVSPKAFRPGYFPHVYLLGEYLPDEKDLFILNVQGFFSLERELPITGIELKEAMERQGVFKAYLVMKGTEVSLSSLPGIIAMPRLPEEARKDFFFVEYIRDMLRLGGTISDEEARLMWEGWKKSREEEGLRDKIREFVSKYGQNPFSREAIEESEQMEAKAKVIGLSDREFQRLWTAEVAGYYEVPGYLPQVIPEQMKLMEKYLELAKGLAKSMKETSK